MKYQGWYRFVLIAFTALVASCGRISDLEQDNSAALQSALSRSLGDSELANPAAQAEMRSVAEEVHNAIAMALIPDYEQAVLSGRATTAAGCSPRISVVFIGISVDFTSSETCHLNGSIAITAFPMKATANIDVVGLQFVQKLTFSASILLGEGLAGSTLSIVYQNAKFTLVSQSIVSSGIASISMASGGAQVDSRINAFEATSGLGVAFIGKVSPGVRTIQSCLLSGASGTDPQAGTLGACFRI